jgi:hypothetical protein
LRSSNNWSELSARYLRDNKAADRVREALEHGGAPYSAKNGMDMALANERRATVADIASRLMRDNSPNTETVSIRYVFSVLDDVITKDVLMNTNLVDSAET